jgi:uncharacterized membrane-anchored protein
MFGTFPVMLSLSVVGVALSEMLPTRLDLGRMIESAYSLGRWMSATIVLLLAASLALWYVERRAAS